MTTGMNGLNPQLKTQSLAQKSISFLSRQLTNTDSFGIYLEPIVQLFRPNWRQGRIGAEVLMLKSETENLYTLTLRPEKAWTGFQAGQYIQLSVEKNGAMLTRTFSVSCSPKQFFQRGEITLTIRSQDQGALTPWMQGSLKSGDYVYLSQAEGEFLLSTSSKSKVFIAGGSGLSPIYSILSQYSEQSWFRDAHLLFYLNDAQSLFFAEKISHLEAKGLKVSYIYRDQEGLISLQQLKDKIPSIQEKEFYICGPGKMIESAQSILLEVGIDKHNIHFEYFGKQATSLEGLEISGDDELIQVDYLDSRKQVTFNPKDLIESEQSTLLDISEQQGINPVTGCRIGVCHQCICKKKTGRVYNTRTQQYSDTGEEEIQLCVSVPVGKVELEL